MALDNLIVLLYMVYCLFRNTNKKVTNMKKTVYFIMLKRKNGKKKRRKKSVKGKEKEKTIIARIVI